MLEKYEFEWDEGNLHKILSRFRSLDEIEALFVLKPFIIYDRKHSEKEERLIAIFNGPGNRDIFICFTFRLHKIRIFSARYMHKKEVMRYEKEKNAPS
ncbi:MAG: BrnT family toxin [Bacteriovoracaceae bacterium]